MKAGSEDLRRAQAAARLTDRELAEILAFFDAEENATPLALWVHACGRELTARQQTVPGVSV